MPASTLLLISHTPVLTQPPAAAAAALPAPCMPRCSCCCRYVSPPPPPAPSDPTAGGPGLHAVGTYFPPALLAPTPLPACSSVSASCLPDIGSSRTRRWHSADPLPAAAPPPWGRCCPAFSPPFCSFTLKPSSRGCPNLVRPASSNPLPPCARCCLRGLSPVSSTHSRHPPCQGYCSLHACAATGLPTTTAACLRARLPACLPAVHDEICAHLKEMGLPTAAKGNAGQGALPLPLLPCALGARGLLFFSTAGVTWHRLLSHPSHSCSSGFAACLLRSGGADRRGVSDSARPASVKASLSGGWWGQGGDGRGRGGTAGGMQSGPEACSCPVCARFRLASPRLRCCALPQWRLGSAPPTERACARWGAAWARSSRSARPKVCKGGAWRCWVAQ